jgi:cytochrome c556
MKKLLMILICFVFVAGAIGVAYAQFAKPEYAIPYNQEIFAKNAMLVETLSRLPWEAAMVPGTDSGDTTLNSEVFMKPAKFKEVSQNLETQATKLVSAAQSGDLISIKTQFGEVGKNCKACHSQFRTK